MFADGFLIRGQVHTIDLIASHIAVQPFDLRTHVIENADRFPGNFLEFSICQIPRTRNLALDDKFRHGDLAGSLW